MQGRGGAYRSEVRRKHYISEPQWAALRIRRQFLENAISYTGPAWCPVPSPMDEMPTYREQSPGPWRNDIYG
jgi:hypothetical protein